MARTATRRVRVLANLEQRLSPALAGRYRIERELGRGGMATVLLAEDLKHHREVAIKVLDPDVAQAIGPGRFQREIETVARLSHPHILPLHDSGEAGGLLYYVMPYVRGESLRDRLEREKQLPVDEALRLTREIASALEHAHGQGVVHRDVKPENVLLQDGQALVADFGIARAAAGGARLTATGVAVGTPAYMSPEQAAGGAVDARTDVYALGCMLYEMLAGQAPFTGPTAESVIFQHLNVPPPAVRAMRPALPAGLDAVLAKAMAKAPADRHATAAALVAALEAGLTAASARPGSKRGALWAGVIALGAVLALVAVAAWQQWGPFGGGGTGPREKKDWILVADFDGPPGDSTLAPATRGLLSAALDQSRIVATVTNDQITEALKNAGKPPSTRLTPAIAKELAYRSAVRTVLEGSIGKLGTGYSVVVRLVDADTARVLFTETATARGDDALIPAMGELAKKLRRGLGENRRSLAATRPLVQIATPSFEAYKLYVQAGLRWNVDTAIRERIRAYRAALALDPDFASAYLGMVYPYMYMFMPDSARLALNAALRRPERLVPVERGLAELAMASLEANCEGALAARDRVLAIDPGNLAALMGSCQDLGALGRYEEGLDQVHRMMAQSPFGPTETMRHLETGFLLSLGQFDETRDAIQRMTGIWKTSFRISLELGTGHFAAAESIARANLGDARVIADMPDGYWPLLAHARFGRGAPGDAAEALNRALEALRRAHDPNGFIPYYPRFFAEYSVVSDGAFPLPPIPTERDTSEAALLSRGLVAGATGNRVVARQCLEALRRRPEREFAFDLGGLPLLEARVAALEGRPGETVRLLRPFDRIRYQRQAVGLVWFHWWLADAFEQMGRPDSAAWYLGRLDREASTGGPGYAAAYLHRRLALLDAKLGRVADAERHLAVAERLWDQPDPAVRRMLEEARAAIRTARAMSPPSARS